jgi:hypothetical protein
MTTLTENFYFRFEEDFIENNVRCIPMIVRFKLDACGIKLKLAEWSRMTATERESLATMACETPGEVNEYRTRLKNLILLRAGSPATHLPILENPAWSRKDEIPFPVQEKLKEFNWSLAISQWEMLSDLQRFALLKLSYPGHENRNFPRAMKEFELIPVE